MVYSLCRRGYREQSGYIWELIGFLSIIVGMIYQGWGDGIVLLVAFAGILVIVIIPIIIQRHIEVLMAEGMFDDLVFYAKLKYFLAWSSLNGHLKDIAVCASENKHSVSSLEFNIREMLGQGESYDRITRVFLGFLHFNNRNFDGLIRDLRKTNEPFGSHSFDELMYLVRAYLETTRYEEAIEAQIALEKQLSPDSSNEEINYKYGNCIVNRMIFFSFLGWIKEFNDLVSEYSNIDFFGLPGSLVNFWKGVCLFNSGSFDEGESLMFSVIKSSSEIDENDPWLPFMRDRLRGLKDNKDFFERKVLPELKAFHDKYSEILQKTIEQAKENSKKFDTVNAVSRGLAGVTAIISAYILYDYNVQDVADLIHVGSNSSLLVNSGEYFRLLTYQFVHIGWLHLALNFYAIRYFAPIVETVAGWPIMLVIYFASGIVGGILGVYHNQILSAGASGSALGLLGAIIVYEIFKTNNIKRLKNRIELATLLFILVLNIAFGFIGKNIDYWAHLGGIGAGAVLALLSLPLFMMPNLKKAFNIVALCALFVLGGYSIVNLIKSHDRPVNFYQLEGLKEVTFDECSFSIKIPESWKQYTDNKLPNRIEAFGLLGEGLRVVDFSGFSDINEFTSKQLSETIREETRKELSDKNISERTEPEIFRIDDQISGYKTTWKYTTDKGYAISRYDYVLGESMPYLFVRFEFATLHPENMYKSVIKNVIKSYKTKDYKTYLMDNKKLEAEK